MRVTQRIGVLAGALGLAIAALPLSAASAVAPGLTTIDVRGTLLVAESDGSTGSHTSYALELANGDLVPVRGEIPAEARTGAGFTGRLALPASVTSVASSAQAALRLVDRRMLTLSVVGSPTVTAPAVTATATVHQQFVAAIDNVGALGQNDATLLGHVSTVGTYWQDQSNGAISNLVVPPTVTHYNTAVALADCGLGSDFTSVIQEAKGKFPGFNQAAGDQLVLFVPDTCASGGVLGEGSVGSSFASGGVLIVKAGAGIDGIYGHETGHNYGFGHAYARWPSTPPLEYYGVYDVMGFAVSGAPGGGNFNQLTALGTPLRVFQGITDVGEIQDVDLGDKSQSVHVTATIKPRTDASGVRSVRVVDPDTGESLYLDYRSGSGRDAGSLYALPGGLGTPTGVTPAGVLHYAPGIAISTPHAGGAIDYLTLDGAGDTSLPAGGTWTSASGSLTVHVSAMSPAAGAAVTVDFAPPTVPFTTVGTPVIGGTVAVGGSVSLGLGTWSPAPTTTTIRWTAGGVPVSGTDDKTSFVVPPVAANLPLVATVTRSAPGIVPKTVASAPVTVAPGTIAVTANPTVTGTARVGSTLLSHPGTWTALLSTPSSTWQWRANGVDIPGATSPSYVVRAADVGTTLSVAEHVTATGYTPRTITSADTTAVGLGVLTVAKPTVTGKTVVRRTLTAHPGRWTPGTTFTYAWFANGVRIRHATGQRLVLTKSQRGKRISVKVTGRHRGYATRTLTSAKTHRIT